MITMQVFISPDGAHWIGYWPDLDSGISLPLHELARGWPSIWREAAPWLFAVMAAYVESRDRGLALTEIVGCGLPHHLVNVLRRGAWPEDLAPYVDEFRRLQITLSYGRVSRRDRALLERYAADAPAHDAILTGCAGIGAVGLSAAMTLYPA